MSDISVVMLIAGFHPYIGGAERQTLEISRALLREGAGVRVVTRRLPGTSPCEEITGVAVTRLYCPGRGLVNSLWFMAASFIWLARHRREYRVIHVQLASSHALAACLAGVIFRKGVLVTIGGGPGIGEIAASARTLPGRLKLRLLALFRPAAITVSAGLKDELVRYGLGALKMQTLPGGVDTGRFSPPQFDEKNALRRRFGLEADTVFLFVGRLAPEKRVAQFLEIWAELRRELPAASAKFVIVGEGPEEGNIRRAVNTLELSDSVALAGRSDNPADYYRACDVFVLPSESEGLPNAMLEAMSCGMGVMATARGGAGEAVEDGRNGLLFDPFNRGAIKALLLRFIAERGLAAALGEAARETAVKRYNMPAAARSLMEVYRRVIAG